MNPVWFLAAFVVAFAVADEKYTRKFDNVDVDQILKNDRLIKAYANCLVNKGNCAPDAAELKKVLPDALATECNKCSDKQKEAAHKVLPFLIKNKPEIWSELEQIYDKSGAYKKKYCARAKEEKLDIQCD